MSSGPSGVSIVAVDTGGTFTDVVALTDGALTVLKVPSTPDDPARAVLDGIRAAVPPGTPFVLVHGSTVATNTLLERTGARVVLVTNRGFEDVIEIGRQNRPQLYAVVGHRPPPLVARGDRIGLAGRLGPDGAEITPLDDDELAALPDRVAGADAVAVSLLHSYADPGHETRVADALADVAVPVSVSARLLPEYREYERTATTVVNAYVAPSMDRYLGRLAGAAGAERVRIMGSGGGAIAVERARREPVQTVLSGPAGGVAGALHVATGAGLTRLLTFDMGGTSTDVSLCPGEPLYTRELAIAGLPVAIPVLDILTVGAGGGSIARVDTGGALRVGPRSAGADPGPICYGRGGRLVTVTDAHAWLGRLPANAFLGGEAVLDRDAIEGPLRELGRAMGTDLDAAAEGVLAVADTAMESALRVISVERGHDPVEFTLVPFGGAAGLHAAELADRLGVPSILVPPDPGVLSAYGMLASPVRKDASRSVLLRDDTPAERISGVYSTLEAEAMAAMAEEGIDPAEVSLRRLADVRYLGQSFELRVPADDWVAAFHDAHAARYGFDRPGATVELVTARVEATGPTPDLGDVTRKPRATAGDAADAGKRGERGQRTGEVVYRGRRLKTRLVERASLEPGSELVGPAIVHEYSATLWVPPEWEVSVVENGSLSMRRARR